MAEQEQSTLYTSSKRTTKLLLLLLLLLLLHMRHTPKSPHLRDTPPAVHSNASRSALLGWAGLWTPRFEELLRQSPSLHTALTALPLPPPTIASPSTIILPTLVHYRLIALLQPEKEKGSSWRRWRADAHRPLAAPRAGRSILPFHLCLTQSSAQWRGPTAVERQLECTIPKPLPLPSPALN